MDAGDKVFQEHLQTASRNAIYTSKYIQNELIIICGNIIRNRILQRIRDAGFFTIIADEITDAANDKQLSISVRSVGNGVPLEKFLGFTECKHGITGEAIAGEILEQLSFWQLDVQLFRAQAYDGAGSMSGKTKGTAARITSLHPKAFYTHCAAHKLNLCIVKCCSIIEVDNMMQRADAIARF